MGAFFFFFFLELEIEYPLIFLLADRDLILFVQKKSWLEHFVLKSVLSSYDGMP